MRRSFPVILFLTSAILSAGENVWTTRGPGPVSSLAASPTSPTLFASVSLQGGAQAFRSLDLGLSWTLLAQTTNATISAFAVDPSRDDIVYAATIRALYLGEGGEVYRSTDGGSSWGALASVSARIRSLVFHPTESGTLYAASTWCRCHVVPCFFHYRCSPTVLRSEDSGATWIFRDTGLSGDIAASLAIDPFDADRLYAGGDTGFAISVDAGEHWTASNTGLEACPTVLALAVRETDGALFAGTGRIFSNRFECGGVYRSLDRGLTWTQTSLPPHYVTSTVIDPTEPRTMYVGARRTGGFFSSQGGVFRSTDGGDTWTPINANLPFEGVGQLAIDPSGRTLHAATSEGVFDYEIVPGARPPVVPPRNRETRTLPTRP